MPMKASQAFPGYHCLRALCTTGAAAVLRRLAARQNGEAWEMPRRILVIDLDNLGDLLLASPAIRALRKRFPDAVLDVLVTDYAAPVIRGNPHVNEIITCNKKIPEAPLLKRIALAWRIRRRKYDMGVILEAHWGYAGFAELLLAAASVPRRIGRDLGKHRTLLTAAAPIRQQHWIETYLEVVELAGATPDGTRMEIAIGVSDEVASESWLRQQDLADSSPIVLFPGGNRHLISRRWRPEGFAAVGDDLSRRWGGPIVIIGGKDDVCVAEAVLRHMRAPAWSAAGVLSLPATGALLRRSRLCITNDSGPLHLASAIGIPIVAIFGPTDPTIFGPRGTLCEIVRVPLPCSPCIRVGDFPDCPINPRELCLRSITPEMVLAAADRLLTRTRPRVTAE
jgi:lipopolysaccharide heptosyltransferase II